MRLSDRVHMLPPPYGHWYLYQAVDQVGRATWGSGWIAVGCKDELKSAMRAPSAALQNVITSIADACAAGKLAAAYQNALDGGVDVLDPREWQKPRLHVETYFANGEAVLYLPYHPPRRELARCERPIFIRKDSLASFIKGLESAPTDPEQPKVGTERGKYLTQKTVVEFSNCYFNSNPNPTQDGLCNYAKAQGVIGGRELLRGEYRRRMGTVRPGRRYKNPPK